MLPTFSPLRCSGLLPSTLLVVFCCCLCGAAEPAHARQLWTPQVQEPVPDPLVLTMLTPEHAPGNAKWSNSVAVCTSVKDEDTGDLLEWVQYYKWLGVDKIMMIENALELTPAVEEALAPHVESGLLDLEPVGRNEPSQMHVYRRCFHLMRQRFNWVAFLDADEYLMLLEKGTTLKELLKDYQEYPALAVNWIMLGANGRHERPAKGGTLRWYTKCRPSPHPVIKSITNSYYVRSLNSHPHNFYYTNDTQAVGEDFNVVPWVDDKRCSEADNPVLRAKHQCRPLAGAKRYVTEVKRIALFHYVTKSWEDFEAKMKRGYGNNKNKSRPPDFFHTVQKETNHTGGICDEGAKAWELCCSE